MNEIANALTLALRDVPIVDWYTTPQLPKKVLTNITELLRTPEKDRMISVAFSDEKHNIMTLSDFEYWKTLIENFPHWMGTREGTVLPFEFFDMVGKKIDFLETLDHDALCELWEMGNKNLLLAEGKYENILKKNRVEKLYSRESAFPFSNRVEKYNNEAEVDCLLCDFRGLPFCRPDAYHASCAETKMRCGETLSIEEKGLLASQALYLLCAHQTEKMEIRLLADADGKTVGEIVDYLKRLDVRGTLYISVDGGMSVDTLITLCDAATDSLDIRPEIVLGVNDSRYLLKQRLHALAARYPIARWHFGGILGNEPLFFSAHQYVREVVCEVLSEITDSYSAAEPIAQQIFENK